VKGILQENGSFQGRDRHCLLHIGLFTLVEATHVSLKRKPSVLEAAVSVSLSPSDN
jgi:hypothetical protein